MATALEIDGQIVQYLAGEQSLGELNIWLARHTWNIQREVSQVRDLVGEIELALTEYSDRQSNEAELRQRFLELVSVQHAGSRETTSTSSASVPVLVQPLQHAGSRETISTSSASVLVLAQAA